MMGFKLEDGKYDDSCLAKARPGTPIFVLVATDASMIPTMKDWLDRNPNLPTAKCIEAVEHMGAVRQWQEANPELVKQAD